MIPARIKRGIERRAPDAYAAARDLYTLAWWQATNARDVLGLRRLKGVDAATKDLLARLRADGIVIGTIEDVFECGAAVRREAFEEAHRMWGEARARGDGTVEEGKEFKVHILPSELKWESPFVRLALDPRMLTIAGHHLGMQPFLRVIDLWWDRPTDTPASETQLWHRDYDDVRIVKAFVYLNDVDALTGPFSFIPGTHFRGPRADVRRALQGSRRTDDERMASIADRSGWRICTGAAGTVVVCDTTGFHKGVKPESKDRLLMLLEYTSHRTHMEQSYRITGPRPSLSRSQLGTRDGNGR